MAIERQEPLLYLSYTNCPVLCSWVLLRRCPSARSRLPYALLSSEAVTAVTLFSIVYQLSSSVACICFSILHVMFFILASMLVASSEPGSGLPPSLSVESRIVMPLFTSCILQHEPIATIRLKVDSAMQEGIVGLNSSCSS